MRCWEFRAVVGRMLLLLLLLLSVMLKTKSRHLASKMNSPLFTLFSFATIRPFFCLHILSAAYSWSLLMFFVFLFCLSSFLHQTSLSTFSPFQPLVPSPYFLSNLSGTLFTSVYCISYPPSQRASLHQVRQCRTTKLEACVQVEEG